MYTTIVFEWKYKMAKKIVVCMLMIASLAIAGCDDASGSSYTSKSISLNVKKSQMTEIVVDDQQQLACIVMKTNTASHMTYSSCYSFTQMKKDEVLNEILNNALKELK